MEGVKKQQNQKMGRSDVEKGFGGRWRRVRNVNQGDIFEEHYTQIKL